MRVIPRGAVAALAALALTVAAAPPAVAATPEQPGGVAGVTVPTLDWRDCGTGDGFQCARAEVPLDYRDLAKGTLSLALARKPAGKPAERIGSLLVNPGGPGGSGVGFARAVVDQLPAAVAERFDVVGFDPRGVAGSSPLACLDAEQTRAAFATTPARRTPGDFARGQALAADFVANCRAKSGALLPYVGTEYVARDIDVLRAALGDDRLNYYGVSFGTFIGTVYANLFPQRFRVLALDGGYDPEAYANDPYRYDLGQYLALEHSFERFLRWCGDTPAKCSFGDGKPFQAFDRLVADLDANPVKDAAGNVTANGASLTYRIIFATNGGSPSWPALAENLRLAATSRTGSLVRPITGNAPFFAANTVVECADRKFPRSTALLRARLAAATALAPRLGPVAAYGSPGYDHGHANACVGWPVEQASRYAGPWSAKGSAPILVVGTTGDPDTPYQDSVVLSKTLANARLLTFVGEGHSGFSNSECARQATAAYLVEEKLPARGARCTDDPKP
ncbi:pimeloyl-ACP methyl ester carboxylesterase [Crossiella equi]|uniref:Pimeloyl-ACP methyl ester carboxylesterase n=1 Tax=Crossiella equi TaxID=130796 RepID=A0ABS5ABX2_9PSEU|nr:alpha/beta hydrolase [Crossiella equi]MBP2474071.1 pimeloyl-ACP methyl ester carboxylesterase [Crossiella equi]